MWHLQRIKSIRNILNQEACETLIVGLVISQTTQTAYTLEFPSAIFKKLQRVQGLAAKIFLKSEQNSLACLKKLHWLPISLRIKFKVLTLLYKSLQWSISRVHQSNGRDTYSRENTTTVRKYISTPQGTKLKGRGASRDLFLFEHIF